MDLPRRLAFAMLIGLAGATSAPALEKVSGPAPAALGEFQSSAQTLSITYYNVCTGWVWLWSGIPALATYGVFYDDPSPEADTLLRSHFYYAVGAPAGYGYTSVVQVFPPFDPSCPNVPPVAQEFLLPSSGWNTIFWNGGVGVPVEDFWVLVSHSPEHGNPAVLVTEKGETGGPRPGGCGICYSPSRPQHSFTFGQSDVIVCPGGPWFDDSPCSLELIWAADVRTGGSVAIESTSWGKVKSLYR